jgi:hypothetical protein
VDKEQSRSTQKTIQQKVMSNTQNTNPDTGKRRNA